MHEDSKLSRGNRARLRLGGNEIAPMDIDDHFDLLVNDPGCSGELPPPRDRLRDLLRNGSIATVTD